MGDYPEPAIDPNPIVDYKKWSIHDGKFYLDGKWKFLKIGKPLINYADAAAVDDLISKLDVIRKKHYDAIEMNCYWHHFDPDGDGVVSSTAVASLNRIINAIYEKGMYPCLSVETYAVGGGQIPAGFWSRFPDAEAIDSEGNKVSDTEYGFGGKVISIFHEGYRETVHNYIKSLATQIDTRKILWFETTVEPQYMGTISLSYDAAARAEYNKWRAENNITDAASQMPETFPIPASFVNNATWNKFRAQFLAKWVNEDAAAYRSVAGENAYVAVDYLDAAESSMQNRDGNPIEFLTALTCPNIIQVNWHFTNGAPNQKAYDRVYQVKNATHRDWAVSEHMTLNGSDYNFAASVIDKLLMNTLNQGTRLGWEFVNILPNSNDNFCLYKSDYSPKSAMKRVDDYWGYWMHMVEEIESQH